MAANANPKDDKEKKPATIFDISQLLGKTSNKFSSMKNVSTPPPSPQKTWEKIDSPEGTEKTGIKQSLNLLKQLSNECTEKEEIDTLGIDTTTTISLKEIKQLSQAFAKALSRDIDTSEAQSALRKKFRSYSNVFDEGVKEFIAENFYNSDASSKWTAKKNVLRVASSFRSKFSSKKGITESSAPQTCLGYIFQMISLDDATAVSIKTLLNGISRWQFNIFEVSAMFPDDIIMVVGCHIMDIHQLHLRYRIDFGILKCFFQAVHEQYSHVPYHNADHAADVLVSLHQLLTLGGLGSGLRDSYKLAALIAAAVHDLGHFGRNNNFLTETHHELAIRYLYKSPLEHFHTASAFQILHQPETNILEKLLKVEQIEVRRIMAEMILATDNAVHSVKLSKFEAKMASPRGFQLHAEEDQQILLQICLHAADVNNPTKNIEIYDRWCEQIQEEFFDQGDEERQRLINVSVGCDRNNPIPKEKMQAGFIISIVQPVFLALAKLPFSSLDPCLEQLEKNLEHWQDLIKRRRPSKGEVEGRGASSTEQAKSDT